MKLLADANIEAAIVRWLREQGLDVSWALELPPATSDQDLLHLALAEGRAIVTHDLDFGESVLQRLLPSRTIVLLRFVSRRESERLALLSAWWESLAPLLEKELFIVVTDDSIRTRPLPGSDPP